MRRTETANDLDDFRAQYAANKQKAAAYSLAITKKKESEEMKRKEIEDNKRKQIHNASFLLAEETLSAASTTQKLPLSKKRRSAPCPSPATGAANSVGSSAVSTYKTCRPLFPDPHASLQTDSFVTKAITSGDEETIVIDTTFVSDAIREGATIFLQNGNYSTKGAESKDFCEWHCFRPWEAMARKIVYGTPQAHEKIALKDDGGLDLKLLGSGTFNAVFGFASQSHLPAWIPCDCAMRITRFDKGDNHEYKYPTTQACCTEARNALFCSANDIGVKVYTFSAFEGPRTVRTLRYATIYTLEKADCDLHRALIRAPNLESGARLAIDVTELVFRASRCGVAFYDIKPGNILRFKDCNGDVRFRLCDFDPTFFRILPHVDWRTLMLLNLALLSSHVRNGCGGEVAVGWATAVSALLRDLLSLRGKLNNDWLFDVRAVRVHLDTTDSCSCSDFILGQHLASMATSYFYGAQVPREARSVSWKGWEHVPHQAQLDMHWRMPHGRASWPPQWKGSARYTPLIEQLVRFATERSRV